MRYFLELAYNGSSFHGWQSQPNAVSVQGEIEKALGIVLGNKILLTGAGRTDTGVNARQMFAHFNIDGHIQDEKKFLISLNHLVGKDIFLKKLIPVVSDHHARFDATERTYKYFVTFQKNPFLHNFCWNSPTHLDLDIMNEACKILLETKDFTSFAKLHSDTKTNICDVKEARWCYLAQDQEALNFIGNISGGIVFTIKADRFLRNMVRAIVGTLVDTGRRKISLHKFKEIILQKDRCAAGTSMPAHALFLWEVKYPFI